MHKAWLLLKIKQAVNLMHNCIYSWLRLNIIVPENTFATQLKTLIDKYPSVDPNALGLKSNSENEPLWN